MFYYFFFKVLFPDAKFKKKTDDGVYF